MSLSAGFWPKCAMQSVCHIYVNSVETSFYLFADAGSSTISILNK